MEKKYITKMKTEPGRIAGETVNSWRNEGMHLKVALAELIDNSIDADATEIRINIESDEITVSDNGRGCDNLREMLTLGKSSKKNKTGKIGRYGVGGTKGMAILSQSTAVISTCGGYTRRADADWDLMADGKKDWEFDFSDPERRGRVDGTIIEMIGLHHKHISKSINSVRAHISRIYSPSISEGVNIFFNSKSPMLASKNPALKQKIVVEGSIESGQRWKAVGGIIVDKKETEASGWKPGFHIACSGRILNSDPYWGPTGGETLPIWCKVTLIEEMGSRWAVAAHKTDISEEQSAMLNTSLASAFSDIIKQSADERADDATRAAEDAINLAMSWTKGLVVPASFGSVPAPGQKKERREKSSRPNEPAHGATGSGPERKRVKKTHDDQQGSHGGMEGKQNVPLFVVRFDNSGMGEEAYRVTINHKTSSVVQMNKSLPWIFTAKENVTQMTFAAATALWGAANDAERRALWMLAGFKDFEFEAHNGSAGGVWVKRYVENTIANL